MRRGRVKPDKRLVHDNQLRLVQKRRDDRKLLLHAVRIAGHRLRQIVRQIEKRRVLMNPALAVRLGYAVNVRHKVEILNAGEKFVEIGVIRNVGKAFLAGDGVLRDGCSGNFDAAAVWRQNAAAGFDGRRLACTVVPDEATDFARGNVKRQIVDGGFPAEGFGQMADGEHSSRPFRLRSFPIRRIRAGFVPVS